MLNERQVKGGKVATLAGLKHKSETFRNTEGKTDRVTDTILLFLSIYVRTIKTII